MQNKYDVRDSLFNEIRRILKKQKEFEVLDLKITIYNELTNILISNPRYIKDNFLMIPFLLDSIMDEDKANKLYESVLVNINDLINLEDNGLKDTKDYEECRLKRQIFIKNFTINLTKLLKQYSDEKNTMKELNELLPKYRKIGLKFKYDRALDEEQINLLYKLMAQDNVEENKRKGSR